MKLLELRFVRTIARPDDFPARGTPGRSGFLTPTRAGRSWLWPASQPAAARRAARRALPLRRLVPIPGILAAAAVVLAMDVAGQTNQAPALNLNRCVVAVPRTDENGTNRFLELNRRVRESGGQAEVIFVGDSITQGWEGSGKEVWTRYYAPRHALNLGIGSDHTQHVLWRLDHGNLDGLKPKVAVVLIGVNNIPDENNSPRMVLEGVTAVVHKLRENLPETKVLLLGIFPFREDFNLQRAKALQVNQALHQLEDGRWIHFLDFGYLFLQADGKISKDLMPDFLHLSRAGYGRWAEAMEPKLAELLGEKPVKK